ncbi:hypothetical protein WMW72_31915 [Paenibacillus filicis]|uniref:Zinc ribbon domain-containing protein n=1 Tax=Paenibacillus filicis TaxID=669464 RepID=A0ABU9DWM2_9BACL
MYKSDKPVIPNWIIWGTFVVFFPVAFLLMVIRMLCHWNLRYQRIQDWKSLGFMFLLVGLGLIVLCYWGSEGQDMAFIFILSIILFLSPFLIAVHFLKKSKRLRIQMEEDYRIYKNMIFQQRIGRVSHMIELIQEKPKLVTNDLMRMQQKAMLPGCWIDFATGQIRLDREVRVDEQTQAAPVLETAQSEVVRSARAPKPPQQPRQAECKGCGSQVVLKPGETRTCEYCGSEMAYGA